MLDPDRRAWHRAHAAPGPDEVVADELERAAQRAQRRGGIAAAAAFLERAAELTPDPARRGARSLAAAHAKFNAAAPDVASELLASASICRLDELQRGQLERLRARIAFARTRGRDVAPLLLAAAERLTPIDGALPPPQITAEGVVPFPSDGARKRNARIAFFYPYTGITPAMCMRVPGIGSQYLMAMRDSDGQYLDGDRTYRLTLPPEIPESRFWSVALYDRQTRSMLQTDQRKPDIGSQSGTVKANPDGSTDIYFGPTAPDGKASNWIQTAPGKGFFTILRLYNPLPPFFDKTWRPSEIEPSGP